MTAEKKSDQILITNEWKAANAMCNPNMFKVLCSAYCYHKAVIKEVSLGELGAELTKVNVNNNKLLKLFDTIYYYTCNTPTGLYKDLVTGFCDVTKFLKHIHDSFDLEFFFYAIKQFVDCGGVIRINNKDFVKGEDVEIENNLKHFFNIQQ